MLNLALKPNQFVGGDVGQIRDDAIESIGRSGKQVRLMEVDLNRVVDCVLAGKAQCFEGNIGGPHCGAGEFKSQRDCDDSRARADIKNADLLWAAGKMLNDQLHELLGLRPRDKCPPIAEKGSAKEFSRPENVLQGFLVPRSRISRRNGARSASDNKRSNSKYRSSRFTKDVRQEVLGV